MTMSRRLRHCLLLTAAFASAACSSSTTTDVRAETAIVKSSSERDRSPTLTPAESEQFMVDQSVFAIDFYKQVAGDPALAGKDVFLSPHSVSAALAMTYAGARGATAAEMRSALHFSLPPDRLHTAMNWLDLQLESRGKSAKGKDGKPFRLCVANSLWGQAGFAFEAPFLDALAINYGAGLVTVDFVRDGEGATNAVNAWVEEKTENRIRSLFPAPLSPLTRLVLVNAVYFNAAWSSPFEPSGTKQEPFARADGSASAVPMMHQASSFPYARGPAFDAVELPYDGGELSMLAIAPDAGTFAAFEAGLTGASVREIYASLRPTELRLGFPRLKVEATFGLVAPLVALGMTTAFEKGRADFSGMEREQRLFVSDVRHKTFLEIDESGTEAAAATAVIMEEEDSEPEPPRVVTFDRPYLVMIVDRATKALIFVGRVMDPKP